MTPDVYKKFIVNSYLDVLSSLAMEFRSTYTENDAEKESKVVLAYNTILDLLLATGWDDGLDPDSELPDTHILERYLTVMRGKP